MKLKSSARAFPAACSGCGAGLVDATAALTGATTMAPLTVRAEVEPNDTIAAASLIGASGTTVNATIAAAGDADYYRVTVPGGRQLGATMTPGASAPDYDLFVYNAAGTLLSSSENGSGAVESVLARNTGTTAADYIVGVRYYSGATGATAGKYALQLVW